MNFLSFFFHCITSTDEILTKLIILPQLWDIYLGMWPATQVNSAWLSLCGWAQWVPAKGQWCLAVGQWIQISCVWSRCYTPTISEHFRDKGFIIKHYKKFICLLYFFYFICCISTVCCTNDDDNK